MSKGKVIALLPHLSPFGSTLESPFQTGPVLTAARGLATRRQNERIERAEWRWSPEHGSPSAAPAPGQLPIPEACAGSRFPGLPAPHGGACTHRRGATHHA